MTSNRPDALSDAGQAALDDRPAGPALADLTAKAPDDGRSGPFRQRRRLPTRLEIEDHRAAYAMDVDRILHSRSYTRYIDKTQVFYLLKNSQITHRVLHVQMVSRIGRTVGQALKLDLDLIEAAALGHDLGHAPFGHDGEMFLSKLCQKAGLGPFVHAAMSLRFLERLEKGGRGLNLTLGVLDAILCHDGESDYASLAPDSTAEPTFAELDRRLALRSRDPQAMIKPLTPEGCVVRLCDSISYVGRDLEDAIEIGLVKRRQLPPEIVEVLGKTNGQIVYRLVTDLIEQGRQRPGLVAFSKPVADALTKLKNFNRYNIYFNPQVKTEAPKIERLYGILFEYFTEEFTKITQNGAATKFLSLIDNDYREDTSPEIKARDFLAGLTDDHFLHLASEILLPKWRTDTF
ncbi:MAG: HD domain-containing protein [Deltaproteobacteria bacterium]|nr:HD domain-containing protein [Deltaproteobacteria bacterium]